ncbi:uncharacterized protein BO88DRAFT_404827 [Aspergillus vadensis CBS 113365]|uniref:Uncharacterized protein n=1 Tax=Aspergillus vadensis (strain CBS 113365 / IMI 142717 / IBT 24658) TaxID=1448311 RepID=A0A319C0Y8_ASPVC|nr:hypothetical protein BO88DRAFT_404827 [Aspergillus vadensis CBS 113365]PYH69118.1 hypothetical protein BO88DRAFT_404827 [Aspergillus vadensis CBS 113365]
MGWAWSFIPTSTPISFLFATETIPTRSLGLGPALLVGIMGLVPDDWECSITPYHMRPNSGEPNPWLGGPV